ncbi:UDP-glucosyltransferase ydhe [Fictibacillus macauensis ZFHKF-1]|uniref:UDP-glucosyltransferase ydhe n=1 Tax=Fictibacillus macauensis ZFHKF-1 TaxID=1196324 RepID=I8UB38_9BACL|nr:macrolide family glycosyltransferase [Fictibacillus macauensis]EIT83988.1 UDP-glucosyltransferase ydhe [Fictibacillus macauensis ZFHKF-1]
MATVLMIGFPAEGHVNPTIGLTKALVDRGDSVHYVTVERFRERLVDVGANVHIHPDHLNTAKKLDPSSKEGLAAFLQIHIATSLDILTVVEQLSKRESFDYVIYDTFGAGELVQAFLGIPSIVCSASFLFPPAMPNPLASIAPDAKMEALLKRMKQSFGVEPKQMGQFMNNRGDVTLVFTSETFQPYRERFTNPTIHFIGPSFVKRAHSSMFDAAALAHETVLYISLGTVLDRTEAFFNLCIEAFQSFPGKVLIATSERCHYDQLQEAPPHITLTPYVPQLEVLQHTDVFITHGGMNSVNESIHYHVPMVVIPHDKDQPLVAKRLTELDAALALDKNTLTAEGLAQAVADVQSNACYREGIAALRDSFQQSGGPQRALAIIDAYINKKSLRS